MRHVRRPIRFLQSSKWPNWCTPISGAPTRATHWLRRSRDACPGSLPFAFTSATTKCCSMTRDDTSSGPLPPESMLGSTYGPACHMDSSRASERSRRPHGRWMRSACFSLRGCGPVTGLTPRLDEGVSMTSDRTILITGVTGHQGGAVARALEGTGFHLRGLTRKPASERAAALARRGVDVVKGDLDDEATLRRALAGAWGVFSVQNTWEAGVEGEEAQGKRLATLAREAGV